MLKRYSAAPYIIWSAIFVVVPLILVFIYSIFIFEANGMTFSIESYRKFLDPLYLEVLWRSLVLATEATVICILLGFPMAMILSKMKPAVQKIAVTLFILPMWMNFLLRTYAWMAILGKNGFINKLLGVFHIQGVSLLYNEGAILLGMVYNFLPFMVLPIYTILTKIDKQLIEAAEDLGADKKTVFRKIILPLSIPGVISGILMVFMPAVSTFVISNLLGGGQFNLIGNLIEQQFLLVGNWHFGSAISMILMVIILITVAVLNRADRSSGGESGVW
jgi:spermidine/putrescine transport system permease protein